MAEQKVYQGHTYQRAAPGQPWSLVGPAQSGMTQLGGPDPKLSGQVHGVGLNNENTAAETYRTKALTPAEVALKEAQARIAKMEADQLAARGGGPQMTVEARNKALAQWQAANAVEKQLKTIEAYYNKGPGATKGFSGFLDYLPTQKNETFDNESNKLRPLVKNLLGTTGGENNAVAEMKLNLGAYIPGSWNFDGTNKQTMKTLRDLVTNARSGAAQSLGGIPDASGRINPIPKTRPRPQSAPKTIDFNDLPE